MCNAAFRRARAMREHPNGGRILGPQKTVLLLLADYSRDGIRAWASATTLGADGGFSERTARTALHALEAGGTITATERADGKATVWRLNLPDPGTSFRGSGANGHDPTPFVATPTPEPPSGAPRNVVPRTPEGGSDKPLLNHESNHEESPPTPTPAARGPDAVLRFHFEQFWEHYPLKEGRERAWRAFRRAARKLVREGLPCGRRLSLDEAADEIAGGTRQGLAYRVRSLHPPGGAERLKSPANFINAGHYADWRTSPLETRH